MNRSRRVAALVLVLATAMSAPFAASAQNSSASPYSWEVSGVSDYRFRGVSQSDNHSTLQGSFTYTTPVGLYASVWGSGVDFGDGGPHTEIDYIVGWGVNVSKDIDFDVQVNRYTYPGSSALDYNELITKTTFAKQYSLTVAYSNDMLNTSTDGWYYALGGEWGLPADFALNANVGRNTFERGVARDYTDWNVGVSRNVGPVNLGLGYYGTDGNGRDNYGRLANNRVVFTVAVGR